MSFPPPTERQARIIWMALTGMALAAVVGLVVALVWGLGHVLRVLAPVLWPLAVAGVLACLLDPVVDFLVRKKVPRTRAIIVVFALALLLVLGLLSSVVPQLVVETRQFVSDVPTYKANLQKQVEQWFSNPPRFLRRYLEPRTPPAGTAPSETNAAPVAPVPATPVAPPAAPTTAPPHGPWPPFDTATLS